MSDLLIRAIIDTFTPQQLMYMYYALPIEHLPFFTDKHDNRSEQSYILKILDRYFISYPKPKYNTFDINIFNSLEDEIMFNRKGEIINEK